MNNNHIIQLDGLRFFAVIMVIIGHWFQWQWSNEILKSLPLVHGVTLFFVLSGFLITRILLVNKETYEKENKPKSVLIKNFYIRRFLRIFPIYYLLIFFLFIISYKNIHQIFPWLVSYTTNIYMSINNEYIGDFNHFWSLAVEEQFYLFWPFIILFIKPKQILPVIISIIIFSLLLKIYIYNYTDKWMANSYFTFSCMHSLGIGALLSYITLYKPQQKNLLSKPIWLQISFVIYIIFLIISNALNLNWYKTILDEFAFSIVAFFIIALASENKFSGIYKVLLENKFISYCGKISYGIYVYHLFIPNLFYNQISPMLNLNIPNQFVFFIIAFLITVGISHLSWKIIEEPTNNLKKNFPYFSKNKG